MRDRFATSKPIKPKRNLKGELVVPVTKFVQFNEKGVPGKVWHSSLRCSAIRDGNKTLRATDNQLKAYGITEKCSVCEAREQAEAARDRELDLEALHELITTAVPIISKTAGRAELRDILLAREVHFSLREDKDRLARKVIKVWLRERSYTRMQELMAKSRAYWLAHIEKQDKHRPAYYQQMLERTDRSIELLAKAIEEGSKTDGNS